jgi:drug/metabolite transporter (DMT)-like permease
MLALSLGMIAALIWAVHDLLARKLSQNTALLPLIAGVLGFGCVVLLGPVLLFGNFAALSRTALGLAVAAGLTFAMASGSLFRAFSLAPARIVAPVIGAYPILSLGAAALQGRPVSALDWLAVFVVFAGIAIVSITADQTVKAGQETAAHKEPNTAKISAIIWAAFSACGFAATFAISQEAVRSGSGLQMMLPVVLPLILITRVVATAIIGAAYFVQRPGIASLRGHWKLVFMMGAFDALALSLVTMAGNLLFSEYASIAASLFGVLTIVLASYFLNEKLRPVQWIGVAMVFSAIGFLTAQG